MNEGDFDELATHQHSMIYTLEQGKRDFVAQYGLDPSPHLSDFE